MNSAESTCPELVDTRDMVVVHTMLLREFRLAPGLVRAGGALDRGRPRRVGTHLRFLLDLLHHHHAGEDRLLWPKLGERAPGALATLIPVMETQHRRIHDVSETVGSLLAGWVDQPTTDDQEALASGLERLHTLLAEHLDTEERNLLPLAATCLTVAEWQEIGEAGVAGIPKSKLALVFGMLMYEGDPAVLKSMLAAAPAVPRALVPMLAPRSYARYAQRVHGTRTP